MNISNHPIFTNVTRQLLIDGIHEHPMSREARVAFHIQHFDADGNSLVEFIPNVSGAFTVTNQKLVHVAGDKIGQKLTPTEEADESVARLGEYDFLKQLVLVAGIDSEKLAEQRILIADANGLFNTYRDLNNL